MKGFTAMLLVCLLFLAGCAKEGSGPVTETEPTKETVASAETKPTGEIVQLADVQMSGETLQVFSAFLDENNIVPGIGQGEMKEQMGRYSYKGEPINKSGGIHLDGIGMASYSESGPQGEYGFKNFYCRNQETNYVNYYNMLYTRVPLVGLSMPFDITFQDDMGQVLEKLELDLDPLDSFSQGAEAATKLAVYQSDSETVVITDRRDAENTRCAFELLYTQTYPRTDTKGRERTVTRQVSFQFALETYQLNYMELKVNEYYLAD